MNYNQKKEALQALALGGKNIFSETAVLEFLNSSDYVAKKSWVAEIQKPSKTRLYISLENDISKRQRQSFRLLSKIQLMEIVPLLKNKKIKAYAAINLVLNDGSIVSQRQKLVLRANQLETEIIQLCCSDDCPDKEDLRRFLLVSILYGDRHHIYDLKTKDAFRLLCSIVAY